MSDSPLRQGLAALSTFFVGDATLHDTLRRVSDLAVGAVPGAEFIGLTMLVDGRPTTAVYTDLESPEIDQAQYRSGHGPCLDAFRSNETKMITSTSGDNPYPEFSEACREHGIHSTLSVPLSLNGDAFGAMNLYSKTEAAFDEASLETARVFAAQAAVVLANAQAYWDARLMGEQLTESIAFRGIIEQAKGIIMSSLRCDADQAFDYLVRQSQHTNTKVRTVALDIVNDVVHRQQPLPLHPHLPAPDTHG